jgi:hypothetical protein
MELGSWKFCANGLRLRRHPIFNEASLSTIRLVVWTFYISRDLREDLTFSCGGEIALAIGGRKRTIMITDCYAVHGDIQPAVDSSQFTNMFQHSAG